MSIGPQQRGTKVCKTISTDLKGELESSTVIVGDFSVLTSMDRSSRKKISAETMNLIH